MTTHTQQCIDLHRVCTFDCAGECQTFPEYDVPARVVDGPR